GPQEPPTRRCVSLPMGTPRRAGPPYGLPAQAEPVLGQFWTPIAGQYSTPIDSFLLRHERISPYRHWTKMHRRWLGELKFAHPAQHLALEEMLHRVQRAEELCDRLKQAIGELVPQWSLAPVVQALQALRGISLITAAVLVAEVGNFQRFDSP